MKLLTLSLAALVLVLALGACGRTTTTEPLIVITPGPFALSPEAAVSLLPWSWEHRDLDRVANVLAADYRFEQPGLDSTGTVPPESTWTREQELASLSHLFQGGGGHPRADAIEFTFGSTLVATPDPRPGRDPRWHKLVRTPATATITVVSGGIPNVFQVHGNSTFYVVRGDSAQVPPGSPAGPDSLFWWVERWEADTSGVGSGHSWMWVRRAFF